MDIPKTLERSLHIHVCMYLELICSEVYIYTYMYKIYYTCTCIYNIQLENKGDDGLSARRVTGELAGVVAVFSPGPLSHLEEPSHREQQC